MLEDLTVKISPKYRKSTWREKRGMEGEVSRGLESRGELGQ